MPENTSTPTPHQWKFFRAGGFDQVQLESGEDLLALGQLDKKLWSALSCPVAGVEFDLRTLQLIDTDQDGHIRVPEIVAAAEWAGRCLKDRAVLAAGQAGVPVAAINEQTAEGERVLGAVRTILDNLGKGGNQSISVEDIASSETVMNQIRFNGDGVITPAATDDERLKEWLGQIMQCLGSEPDRSGEAGIGRDLLDRFAAETAAWLEWNDHAAVGAGRLPEPEREEALALWNRVRPKIDDYFLRCGMAAFDSRAAIAMNSSDESLAALAPRNLTEAQEEMAALPLAAVAAPGALDLRQGLNPAWEEAVNRLRQMVVKPFIGDTELLTSDEWLQLKLAVQDYEAWWRAKPETTVAELGADRLRAWVTDGVQTQLGELIDQDLALAPAFEAMIEAERLVRYCRDLLPLANNFVSFRDFYTRRSPAIFQAGTLYLDGRSFELCITVTDVAKHALLANLSRVYLVYCDCTRNGGADKITIAAAITDGDSDQLLVGRNGVFFDRKGQDWDASIVRIIDHPISIRQAFWSPYKRIGKMVGEQLQKVAAARSRAAEEKAAIGMMQAGQKKDEVKPAQQAFDAGKFAGIFAAIGLAIGAIGTALASILTGFLKLAWWQMPLALCGVLVLISGPSIVIAWFKLRQRNLGRLLDATGWAVNSKARINIPFGRSLTALAKLPQGAARSLSDPYEEKRRPWLAWLIIALAAAATILLWRYGYQALR